MCRPLFSDFLLPEPDVSFSELRAKDRWAWYAECMEVMERAVPYGDEPEVMSWDDPLESRHKEPDERWNAEDEVQDATRELVKALIWQEEIGEVDPCAVFFLSERLRWCRALCLRLGRLPEAAPCVGMVVAGSPGEVWRWLLIEVYESFGTLPRRWREKCSADEW